MSSTRHGDHRRINSTSRCGQSVVAAMFVILSGSGLVRGESTSSEEASPTPSDRLLEAIDSPSLGTLDETADEMTVEVRAGVWLPRLGGQVRLGPEATTPEISVETQFEFDSLEPAPNVEINLDVTPEWRVRLHTFDFGLDGRESFVGPDATFGGIVFQDGDAYDVELDVRSYAVAASYALSRPRQAQTRADGARGSIGFAPEANLRYIDVDQQIDRLAGGVARGDGTWIVASAGLGLRWSYVPPAPVGPVHSLRFEATGLAGVAINGGGTAFEVRAGLAIDLAPQASFGFGYRLLEMDLEDDDYLFSAGLQGIFVSGSIRF